MAFHSLRYWQEEMEPGDSLALLKTAVQDENQRVRLEALIDLGYHANPKDALPVVTRGLSRFRFPSYSITESRRRWLAGPTTR